LDNVLIGRYWGPAQLGLYSKAYALLLLPLSQINQPITHVAIPALSQLQGDPERFRRFFCKAMNSIAYLTMPLIAVMAVLSEEIIEIMLGPQWIEAGKIFKILAFAGIVQTIGSLCGWIFITLGQTDRMMKWGLIIAPVNILSFIIGLKWGPIGVALSYTIVNYVLLYPSFYVTFKHSPVKTSDVLHTTWRPVTLSALTFCVVYFVRTTIGYSPLFMRASLSLISAILTLSLLIAVWPKAKADVSGIFDLLKSVTKQQSYV
jgi:PST family polysaccharide transporter